MTTRDIAIYGAVVATLSAAWTLYSGLIRDRPRVKLVVYDEDAWDEGFEHSEDAVAFRVSNRGRRPIHIGDIVRVSSLLRGTMAISMELQRAIRDHPEGVTMEEGQGRTYRLGGYGDYQHGELPLRRWQVHDQAGRIYPLRERYRFRVERFLLFPIRFVYRVLREARAES